VGRKSPDGQRGSTHDSVVKHHLSGLSGVLRGPSVALGDTRAHGDGCLGKAAQISATYWRNYCFLIELNGGPVLLLNGGPVPSQSDHHPGTVWRPCGVRRSSPSMIVTVIVVVDV
jgi:hypothetical protein